MKFSRNNKPTFEIPAEGYYSATVVGWKQGKSINTIMGSTPSVLVTFDLGQGIKVMQSMLNFAGPTSLVEKLVDATVGPNNDDIDFDDLIGKNCGVEIKHNHIGSNTYANVVDVFPESELEDEQDEDSFENEEEDNSFHDHSDELGF
jgi:hypothetical protein